jgi:hypothetical protein
MDSLVKSTHHAGRGEAGRLSVGFYTSISAGTLRATLVDYQKRFSQIDIYLKESSRMRLVAAASKSLLFGTVPMPPISSRSAVRMMRRWADEFDRLRETVVSSK